MTFNFGFLFQKNIFLHIITFFKLFIYFRFLSV